MRSRGYVCIFAIHTFTMLQKKLADILFSTKLMAFLFIIFALAMAVGTFVENSYTTTTAREWIYNTWWFEAIMGFFVINFIGNIFRFKLLRKEKITTLTFHLSFILILLGAWITRYIGYEATMPIREGEVTNEMMSQKTYLTTYIDGEIDGEMKRKTQHFPLVLAPGIDNNKTILTDFNGNNVSFEVVEFIKGAEKGIRPAENGTKFLKLVEAGQSGRENHFLEQGKVSNIHNVLFAYNKYTEGAINILGTADTGFTIKSPFEGNYMVMATQQKGKLHKDSIQDLKFRSLYTVGESRFVFPEKPMKGKFTVVKSDKNTENLPNGVKVNVTANGETKQVSMLGGKGYLKDMKEVKVGGYDINLRYGSKKIELPFSIKLNDFIATKQPGTEDREQPSYQAFRSKVKVVDGSNSYNYDIYMNHVLDHGGYRFFQSSFQPDEKGTVLSVNHDKWGTWITYIGYFLLYAGLMMIMFDKGSRFGELRKRLEKVKKKKAKLATLLLFLSFGLGNAQESKDTLTAKDAEDQAHEQQMVTNRVDSVIQANAVKKEHAEKFGKLIIQDYEGRMKPINTYSSELMRKISNKDEYLGYNADQLMLSMLQVPQVWYAAPIIEIAKKNDSIHKILGVNKEKKYVSLTDFFTKDEGKYKLSPYLQDAYQAKPKNKFQKDFIDADEKVNLLFNTLQGRTLSIFPVPKHHNNKWVSFYEFKNEPKKEYFKDKDSIYVSNVLPLYVQTLNKSKETGDYKQPNDLLKSMKSFQQKYGSEVMPSQTKIDLEILYNKIDIFNLLFQLYLYLSLLMIFAVIFKIFKENKIVNALITFTVIGLIVLFIAHTAGLGARWYISGHAPWSNAYESMVYVAWATMFFGLAFGRKSQLTMASTAFVTSIILMVAHWNWLDPAVGNLQPVLDSYWLMIHVAVIVASYGPFTLGAIIGLVALGLMLFMNENNKEKLKLNIRELSIINELALTVGLIMLTIGNFLGGQWANESWGRYWGWDPKETWALISIIVYAFVIHMRFVPGLRGNFAFNWGAVIAFGSILMTYFGVNFYLTGLHSYASGDQIISYQFIIGSLVVLGTLGYFARRKFKKHAGAG